MRKSGPVPLKEMQKNKVALNKEKDKVNNMEVDEVNGDEEYVPDDDGDHESNEVVPNSSANVVTTSKSALTKKGSRICTKEKKRHYVHLWQWRISYKCKNKVIQQKHVI